jgi:hypothetical protein
MSKSAETACFSPVNSRLDSRSTEVSDTNWINRTERKRSFMKTECTSRISFLNPRGFTRFAVCTAGLVMAFAPMRSAVARDSADGELSQLAPAQVPGRWIVTGDLNVPHGGQTATLLQNGKVLVAGGDATGVGAELYDPATGMWTPTGSMVAARGPWKAATLLQNGKVLVAGGQNGPLALASAELYDPATGVWTATGSMHVVRNTHTATLLLNGQVLVAGGDAISGTSTTIRSGDGDLDG